MTENFLIACGYLLVTNIYTFLLYGYDKWCAEHDKWRVSEKTLLFWSFVGGALGAFLAMIFFHHKTLQLKFKLCVPFFLCLQIFLIALILINPGNFIETLLSELKFDN